MKRSGLRLVAALVTPRKAGTAEPDWAALEKVVELVLSAGVDGVCMGGATSEFPHWPTDRRKQVLSAVARAVAGRARLLAGVGAAAADEVWDLGDHALAAGYEYLLIPPPGFYRYEQSDLLEFYRAAANRFQGPILLYNLPAFTTPLAVETMLELLRSGDRIVGVKDSSGEPALLRRLADRPRPDCLLLVGSDELILEGFRLGWDGVVSGVASCCPELVVRLVKALDEGREELGRRLQGQLDELCHELDRLPFPWGIRACLEARGIATGPRPWPVSASRRLQEEELRTWFRDRLARLELGPKEQ
jgi:4-hydroxy-tetrahydrodipicolinate synthase